MIKTAVTDFPIQPLLASRWSPLAFSDRLVSAGLLKQLFEAARWSPSSINEQPWRFIIGTRDGDPETYEKILSTLVEFNRQWAETAPVLILGVAKKTFTHNGNPNRYSFYDIGQAVGGLLVEAEALGLHTHQMGGYDVEKAREIFALPADFDPVAVMALGYLGDPDRLPNEKLQARHSDPVRTRHSLTEFVFSGTDEFGAASPIISK